MDETYILDQNYENTDFIKSPLSKAEYENCSFKNCNFEYSDLSQFKFTDCEFVECNLSMAKLIGTAFRDVVFRGCKMFGMPFDDCNQFGLSFCFDECSLNNSVFYKTAIRKTILKIQSSLK